MTCELIKNVPIHKKTIKGCDPFQREKKEKKNGECPSSEGINMCLIPNHKRNILVSSLYLSE